MKTLALIAAFTVSGAKLGSNAVEVGRAAANAVHYVMIHHVKMIKHPKVTASAIKEGSKKVFEATK